tara:strand:- start:55 stop:774 length:720 start_codon:yes stop_codon:yes gene_type:complete
MAGKSKLARGALDALTDIYKKKFGPETYYHYSDTPNIEKFDPEARDSWPSGDMSPYPPRGATFFTSDPKYTDKIFDEKIQYNNTPSSMFGLSETRRESFEHYVDPNFVDSDKFAPTVYPVKIKTDNLFDYGNKEGVDELINFFGKYWDREFGDETEKLLREGDWSVLEIPSIQNALKDAGYKGYKTNEPGTIALFHPDKGDVRSIFAKFDPKKSKSGNILASVPVAALAIDSLSELESD